MAQEASGTAVDVEGRIREFIRNEVIFDAGASLEDDTPLLEGIMDSMALMQLVSFLEEEFVVEVDDLEITKSNFASVGRIGALVRTKIG